MKLKKILALGICLFSLMQLDANSKINLSSWDFSPVSLDGEWDFWPNSLPKGEATHTVKVPGRANEFFGGNKGWGNYQVILEISKLPGTQIGLFIPAVNSAANFYLNDKLIARIGNFAQDENTLIAERSTRIVEIEPNIGSNILRIEIANKDDQHIGLTESLKIGQLSQLYNERNIAIATSIFMFGCLFIMGIYHIGMFLYRPQNTAPLWFGILAILLGLRGLVYGPIFLFDMAPWVGYMGVIKLGFLTFSAAAFAFNMFLYKFFHKFIPSWFYWVNFLGSGLYSIIILFFPPLWFTPILPIYQIYIGLFGLVVIFFLIRASARKLRGSWLFLSGFVIFFTTVVHDIIRSMFILSSPELSTLGLLIFLVFQSLVILRSFNQAFIESEQFALHVSNLNQSLERFIPKKFLSFLSKSSIIDIKLGDHIETEMAVMFADIRDFTTLSETMTPQENFNFINSYLSRIGPIVRKHHGFVDKYLGDGIMALFPNNTLDAARAAIDICKELKVYNEHRSKFGYASINLGIGIHYGPLMIGTIGEDERMDSTVISDTVNTASRLEGLTKKYPYAVLMSDAAVNQISPEDGISSLFLGNEQVKGKTKVIGVYGIDINLS